MMDDLDVVVLGRVGVDLYPLESRVRLKDVVTFRRFLGGTAANVAAAAARLGLRSALISKVGLDPFGEFVREDLERLGVDVRWLGFHPSLRTPLAFCELFPPDNFPLLFYRSPLAPDATISSSDFDIDIAASAAIVWTTGTGLATDAGRNAAMALLADRRAEAVHDLDYREVAWASPAAAAAANRNAIRFASVVVGNLEEAAMVTGSWDPSEASANLLAFGPRLAVVKCGPAGVFFRSEEGAHLEAGVPVSVVNGLGAGDAFGGALCFALRRGWPIDTTARFCNVAGALVATRLACADAMPTVEEINQFMAGHSA